MPFAHLSRHQTDLPHFLEEVAVVAGEEEVVVAVVVEQRSYRPLNHFLIKYLN
jgi:hypothetical protein